MHLDVTQKSAEQATVQSYFACREGEDVKRVHGSTVQKLTLDKVLDIPDGGTVVCRLGRKYVECPAHSDDRCGSNMFCDVAEPREVFLLVTARVTRNDEDEGTVTTPSGSATESR